MSSTNEQFWLEDPINFLVNQNTLMKIIPNKNMSLIEQLNAAMRFSLYFSLIVFIVRRDPRTLFFAVFVGLFTIFIERNAMKKNAEKKQVLEKMDIGNDKHQGYCSLPTQSNPFMNVNIVDYQSFPNKPPACNVTKDKVKEEMQKKFEIGTFRDVDDIYGKNASDRQWYTMPSTTIPNDQKSFAEALYPLHSDKQKHNNYKIYK